MRTEARPLARLTHLHTYTRTHIFTDTPSHTPGGARAETERGEGPRGREEARGRERAHERKNKRASEWKSEILITY